MGTVGNSNNETESFLNAIVIVSCGIIFIYV